MAEYIEREAVEKFIENGLNNSDSNKAFGFDAVEILAEVHYMPAADVTPVVHARWVDGKCSNCGADIPTDDAHDAIFESECHYCYFCGAKMGGEA